MPAAIPANGSMGTSVVADASCCGGDGGADAAGDDGADAGGSGGEVASGSSGTGCPSTILVTSAPSQQTAI